MWVVSGVRNSIALSFSLIVFECSWYWRTSVTYVVDLRCMSLDQIIIRCRCSCYMAIHVGVVSSPAGTFPPLPLSSRGRSSLTSCYGCWDENEGCHILYYTHPHVSDCVKSLLLCSDAAAMFSFYTFGFVVIANEWCLSQWYFTALNLSRCIFYYPNSWIRCLFVCLFCGVFSES